MGRVLTNSTGLRVATETSVGVLPGSPAWTVLEFNTLGAYGAKIATTPRRPISQLRGRKKGTVTDLDSGVEFETDLTLDAFTLFAEGFFFSEYANVEFDLKSGTGTLPPPATGTVFTIDAASATLGGKVQFNAAYATLVYGKGYALAANNGVKVLTVDLATSGVSVTVAGTTAETPPVNASLQIAGVRTINNNILTVASDGTGTMVVSTGGFTWASLGILPGMYLHLGGVTAALALTNSFTIAATTVFGYVRVVSVSGGTCTFDKADPNLLLGGAGSSSGTQTVDILFGRFARNVAVSANVTDNRYLERTYTFEASYPNLGAGGVTEYEYAVGNFASELTLNTPLTDKAGLGFKFVGTSSDAITATRKTVTNTVTPLRTTAINTSSDLVGLSTDVVAATTDVCFKSLTFTILNNVSPEKCLGTLGARFVNAGLFEFNIEGQMLFTRKEIIAAIRNNTTVTFAAVQRNEDGAIVLDVPSMTLEGGDREYPVDQSVLVNIAGKSFTSATFGFDVSTSVFPVVPIS